MWALGLDVGVGHPEAIYGCGYKLIWVCKPYLFERQMDTERGRGRKTKRERERVRARTRVRGRKWMRKTAREGEWMWMSAAQGHYMDYSNTYIKSSRRLLLILVFSICVFSQTSLSCIYCISFLRLS